MNQLQVESDDYRHERNCCREEVRCLRMNYRECSAAYNEYSEANYHEWKELKYNTVNTRRHHCLNYPKKPVLSPLIDIERL